MCQLHAVKDSVLTWGGLIGTFQPRQKGEQHIPRGMCRTDEESAEVIVPKRMLTDKGSGEAPNEHQVFSRRSEDMQRKQKTSESYRSDDRAEPEGPNGAYSISFTEPDGKETLYDGLIEAVISEKNLGEAFRQVVANHGEINVIGNANSVEVYNVGGILISKDEMNVKCNAGIYLVKVDGKVSKVIVR